MCSVSVSFNWNFNFLLTQFRKLSDTKMQRQLWWVYSVYFEWFFIWMQSLRNEEQWLQTREIMILSWVMIFVSVKWFSDFESILEWEALCYETKSLHITSCLLSIITKHFLCIYSEHIFLLTFFLTYYLYIITESHSLNLHSINW